MNKNVLITGGTGLIGSRLTEILQQNGYQVSYLSRSRGEGQIKKYQWDIHKNSIDKEAVEKADYIINLAGANVFEKRWSKEFKKEIADSRSESIKLLYNTLKSTKHTVKAFISASAIGIYGSDTGDKVINESAPYGTDFLAEVVKNWETSADQIEQLSIRTVKLRIGIVFSDKGGALEQLTKPIRLGAGAALASGKQYMSWVHVDDICNMFLKAIEDATMKGAYNAVAPNPATNEEITKAAAAKLSKSIFLPNVPGFVLKLMLGSEKAELVIGGNKVSPNKIINAGYQFKFPELKNALANLLK
jgi:uncharacterized protein (TIGR01777 family)